MKSENITTGLEPTTHFLFFWGEGGGTFFFLGGGGGGGGGGNEHEKEPHIFYTQHIVTISSTKLYSLMKIFLMVFKIEGIVALTIKAS